MNNFPFRFRRKAKRAPSTVPGEGGTSLHSVTVVRLERVSSRGLLIGLRAADGSVLDPYAAGAHVDLHLGGGIVRQYSLVDIGQEEGMYAICVQREPGGRGGSIAAHEQLREGSVVRVSAPRNTFCMQPAQGPVVLLSAGVGVTPVVSMAAELHRLGVDFEFHAYARSRAEMPLLSHLENAAYRDRFFFHDSGAGDTFRGSAPTVLERWSTGGELYVCGPAGFVDLARERASRFGWADARVHSEQFAPSAPSSTARPGAPFSVVAASTGEEMTVASNESIADVLERHGYETFRSCGQGYCGSCVTRVIAGTPDHRDTFQSPEEHQKNTHINLCCSRSLTPSLTLDV